MEARMAGGGTEQLEQLLDLSQISSDRPIAEGADGALTSMFYEPEDFMTEEQMKEADPLGEKPYWDQFWDVLSRSEFPTFWEATVQVLQLILLIVLSASFTAASDRVLKYLYVEAGALKSDQQIQAGYRMRLEQEGLTEDDMQTNEKAMLDGLKNMFQKDQKENNNVPDL
jgi:hypothetical protein